MDESRKELVVYKTTVLTKFYPITQHLYLRHVGNSVTVMVERHKELVFYSPTDFVSFYPMNQSVYMAPSVLCCCNGRKPRGAQTFKLTHPFEYNNGPQNGFNL